MRAVSSGEVGARLGEIGGRGRTAELWFAWVGHHARDVDRFSREILSAEERTRLVVYRSREAAERYVVTRSLVRVVLSEHLGIRARDVDVRRTDLGKPILAEGMHFNVSHSGDLILLAVSDDCAVGVDVERRRDVARVEALARRWLADSERRDMDELVRNGTSASDAFLRLWSLKEARLKALGVGISGAAAADLHRVTAEPLDRILGSLMHERGEAYVGALAFA